MESKVRIKRKKIIAEILSTEESYVKDLRVLCNCFVEPLKAYLLELQRVASSPQQDDQGENNFRPTLQSVNRALDEHSRMFSNIGQLLAFNEVFHGDLLKSFEQHEGNNVGGIFSDAAPFFKMYSTYTSNFEIADAMLKSWLTSSDVTLGIPAFIRGVELQKQCHGLRLLSFLIMPVQRIPRYKMLLTELIKVTHQQHPDFSNLKKSHFLISSVASHLNNDMKEQEIRKATMDVASQFDALSLLTPSRLYVKHAVLKKVCRHASKPFTFVLFNDLIIYGSPKLGIKNYAPNGEKYHSLHRQISLHNSFVLRDPPSFPEGFLLISSEKSFYIDCGTLEAKNDWVDKIEMMHNDLDTKLQQASSWRSKYSKFDNEVEVWSRKDQHEESGEEVEKESWGLNPAAMAQGRGIVQLVTPEEINVSVSAPGVAMTSKTFENETRHSRGSSLTGAVSSGLRRMSHKFTRSPNKGNQTPAVGVDGMLQQQQRPSMTSDMTLARHAPPESAQTGPPIQRASTSATPLAPGFATTFSSNPFENSAKEPKLPFNTILYNGRPHSVSDIRVPPPKPSGRPMSRSTVKPPTPTTSSRFTNMFLDDSSIKYTGEFSVKCGVYGLGLELTDVTSPYSDHPSRSIVLCAGFPNLPNGNHSPGQDAGVKKGDYLVMVNGVGVTSVDQVQQLLRDMRVRPGDGVALRIRRGGGGAATANAAQHELPTSTYATRTHVPHSQPARPQSMQARTAPQHTQVNMASARATNPRFSLVHTGGGNIVGGGIANRPPQPPRPAPMVKKHSQLDNRTADLLGLGGDSEKQSPQQVRHAKARDDLYNETRNSESTRGSNETFDPANLNDMDFLNLFGVTKHKYRMMAESQRRELRQSIGLE